MATTPDVPEPRLKALRAAYMAVMKTGTAWRRPPTSMSRSIRSPARPCRRSSPTCWRHPRPSWNARSRSWSSCASEPVAVPAVSVVASLAPFFSGRGQPRCFSTERPGLTGTCRRPPLTQIYIEDGPPCPLPVKNGARAVTTARHYVTLLVATPTLSPCRCRRRVLSAAHDDGPIDNIRNFSIIAHIDHGKSTLADRLIQLTGGLEDARNGRAGAQFHGHRARARHHHQGADRAAQLPGARRQGLRPQPDRHARPRRLRLRGQPLARRLRRLAAGGRRSQGVEAQTLANVYQAIDNNHEIVPVLNKVDLPAAEPDKVKQQIEDVIGLDASNAVDDFRQDRPERARRAGSDRHPPAAAQGRPRRAAEGAAGRQLVRRLSRRRGAGARRRRRAEQGPAHPHDGHRRRL